VSRIFDCSGQYARGISTTDRVARAYAAGARIANNSWGQDGKGRYDAQARLYDALVRDAQPDVPGNQEFTQVFATGNQGAPGKMTADGYRTIASPASAKNVISVGASENVRSVGNTRCGPDAASDSAVDMASFSSRGPTDDDRVKPDVVAPGSHVIAAQPQLPGFDPASPCGSWPVGSSLYYTSSGTSMAAPQVSGAAALLRVWYQKLLGGGRPPSPAMTKALLVASARDIAGGEEGRGPDSVTGPVPDSSQGFGAVDLSSAFGQTGWFVRDQGDVLSTTGAATTGTFTPVDPTKPVGVTIAWTDAPGHMNGWAFVNDLDLTVSRGAQTFFGNLEVGTGVPVEDLDEADRTHDTRNNVETVLLEPGSESFSVAVRGTAINGDGIPGNGDEDDQDYALVVTNATRETGPALVPDGPLATSDGGDGDGAFEPGERVVFDQPVTNVGDGPGTGATIALDGELGTVTPSATFGTLAPGATASASTPLVGRVPGDAACGAVFDATLGLRPPRGRESRVVARLATGAPGAPAAFRSAAAPPREIEDAEWDADLGQDFEGTALRTDVVVPAGTGASAMST
jgi:hypothetical protein